MTEVAQRTGLAVVRTLTEEKSAKEPHQRPVFDRLLRFIRDGQAEAILCYHVNRLARNMVEGGELQHLLTKGLIQEIRTHSEVFTSLDNILPFVLQTAMSTQYSLDLSVHVKRGLYSKAAKGDFPGRAPEGYRNDVYNRLIESDPDRFDLIRKAWELMLTGRYSLETLLQLMTDQWGYRSRTARQSGGRPLTKSGLHHLFHNIFYTGWFYYGGELRQGNHQPMVTFEEFEQVQRLLRQRGRPRPQRHEFAYTGLISCELCGRQITAEIQRGQSGRGSYVYYHCTNHRVCRGPFVREERIEEQIARSLRRVALRPSAQELAADVIKVSFQSDYESSRAQVEQQRRAIAIAEQRRSKLIRLRVDDLISDDELVAEKTRLEEEMAALRQSASQAETSLERATQGTLAVVRFAVAAPLQFQNAQAARKKQIARSLAQAYRLQADGELSVELHPLIAPLAQGSIELDAGSDSTCSGGESGPSVLHGRGEWTRTTGPCVPNAVL